MSRIKILTTAALTLGLVASGGVAWAGVTPSPSPTGTVTPPPVVNPQSCTPRPITFAPAATPTGQIGLTAWHGYPTPTPTPTQPIVTPTPPVVNPLLRCAPETFVAQVTALGATVVQNRVIASGPVFGTGSLDLAAQTDTFDRFNLPGFFRSVNVPHTGLAFPSVNLRLCTASVVQVGLWRFNRGAGLFRRAAGNGSFQLVGQWVFPRLRNGLCSLLFLRGNPLLQNRVQPRYTNIQVWATGLARR